MCIRDSIGSVLDNLLEKDRGPLREELGPDLIAAIESALAGIAPSVADKVAHWAEPDDFGRTFNDFLDGVAKQVGDQPIGGALGDEHRDRITAKVLSLIHISEPTRLLSISYAVFCLK